jgi:uncharacterized protein (DUF885 family)
MHPQKPSFSQRRQVLGWLAGSASLSAVGARGQAVDGPQASGLQSDVDAWSDAFAADWVRLSAEGATYSQFFTGAEQAAFERELTPNTPAQRDKRLALARRGLADLARFDAARFTPAQHAGVATLRWSLERTVAGAPFADMDYAFSQQWGAHLRYVNLLTQTQSLRKPADVDAYVSRLSQVGARIVEALDRQRESTARGFLPPRFILERTREQVKAFLAPAAAQNDFVAALVRKTETLAGLAPEDRQKAIDRAVALVSEQVRPACLQVLAWMDDVHPRTTADAGLWRFPDGAAAYAQALASNTTTAMSAEEIHALGLREVARIEGEMDRVLRGLGRREGTVEARMGALRKELQPPTNPDPRPLILARYTEAVRDAERRAQSLFHLQPAAPVEVRRVPALTERTASAYYTTPAPDGSRPGIFWAPLPGPDYDMLRIRSLAVHEAVPGHHFQLALQQEQRDLPLWRQRRVFGGGSAHSEGWGLYAERLALDNGWYDGDPHALLGGLDGQLFRARRLVVDTGLHAQRWTREQAIAYGLPAHEVERYVSNPGQACAYMIGMLHMLKLRDDTQKALGARFRIKDFHDVVLKTGSVPLEVLSDVVRRWAGTVV